MESQGQPGRIHVSAATRQALGDRFRFEPRGRLDIKGRGLIETYFLMGNSCQSAQPNVVGRKIP